MKKLGNKSVSFLFLALFFLLFSNPEAFSQMNFGGISGGVGDLQALAGSNYSFLLIKQTVGLWADGRGDVILERTVKNIDITDWSNTTWYFDWPPGSYSQIRAWDDAGPLTYSTARSGTRIDITVQFRRPVQPGQSYHFSLAITIGNMASVTSSSGRAWWYNSPGFPVQNFAQGVTFPSNSTFQNISPTPTTQNSHYLEWHYTNTPSDFKLTIDVNYTLSSTVDVPLIQQTNPTWSDAPYGRFGGTIKIGQYGAYLSTGGMGLGIVLPHDMSKMSSSLQPNPVDLNTWLKNNLGYDAGNFIVQSALPRYAQENGGSFYFKGFINGRDDAVLDDYLSTGYPVILGVNPQTDSLGRTYPVHYVLATGKTTVNSTQTYIINDPIYGTKTLYDQWNNNYYSMTLFSGTPADRRSLRISAHSPVELLVTGPTGLKSGYDPQTAKFWNEIPDATYFIDAIAADADPSHGLLEAKVLLINIPTDGEYTLTVFGTGTGPYEINSFASDWTGKLSRQIFSGTVQAGSLFTNKITYSSYMGINQTLFLPLILK
jgi:hypothetical protein